jgi:hypothetical protein
LIPLATWRLTLRLRPSVFR